LVAARRLGADRVAIVFAARDGDGTSFAPEGVPSVKLAPLSGESARALLAERVGAPMPDDVVDRLMTHAAGNPLALVELPTTLTGEQLTGAVPLPVSSASKADLVRSLGADHVIDYAHEDQRSFGVSCKKLTIYYPTVRPASGWKTTKVC
jgi:hypothetical protein